MSESLLLCEDVDLTKEVEDFLKSIVPEDVPDFTFSIPTDPTEQLQNALAFARTVPHGKFAFRTGKGGFCMRGYLLGGNGIVMSAGTNYGYPFSGTAEDILGNSVDLSVFREADKILDNMVPGGGGSVMQLNDTRWFDRGYALSLLEHAIELA